MAMPKDFSADGAVGAGGPGMSTAPGMTPPPSASAPAAIPPPTPSASGTIAYAPGGNGGGASFIPHEIPSASSAPTSTKPSFQTGNAPGASSGGGVSGAPGSAAPLAGQGGIFFDEGGSVPDDNGQSQQQDPMSSILQRSMGSVDTVLQQLYKSYGLSTGDQNQQGGVQEAANMPMQPAGQSETGVPPQRPAPGQLPPTNNPFGKRADAGGIPDDDDQGSA